MSRSEAMNIAPGSTVDRPSHPKNRSRIEKRIRRVRAYRQYTATMCLDGRLRIRQPRHTCKSSVGLDWSCAGALAIGAHQRSPPCVAIQPERTPASAA